MSSPASWMCSRHRLIHFINQEITACILGFSVPSEVFLLVLFSWVEMESLIELETFHLNTKCAIKR